MLKKILFTIVLATSFATSAQTTLIDPAGDGGFESGATLGANGWTELNPPNVPSPPFAFWNRWVTNTAATGYTGARAAYITNNILGSPAVPPYASYSASVPIQPKFHRIIAFPAGETDISLNFDWQGVADADDFLRVWLVPQGDAIPNGPYAAPTGMTPADRNLIGSYTGQASWTNTTIIIPAAYAGNTTTRLVFEWSSNATVGGTPAAIDNIELITSTPSFTCAAISSNSSDYIDDFSTNVGGASDVSNLASGFTTPGLDDQTAQTVTQFPGGLVEFAVDFGSLTNTYGFNIWVDFNSDGDFDDAGEQVFATGGYITTFSSDFLVPSGTPTGTYTMRIRADLNSSNPAPCSVISEGEAEDYSLFVPVINCNIFTSISSINTITDSSATINWATPSPAPGVGYEYFVTTNNNLPGYSQVPTGSTLVPVTTANLTGLLENTTYYVYVRTVCNTGSGGVSLWNGPEPFTTLATPPVTTSVNICVGDPSQDLTASASCVSGSNLGSTISGAISSAGPFANTLPWFHVSTDPCAFDASYNKTYGLFDFEVDTAGTYVFLTDDPNTSFDPMGYIVSGAFTYGTCPGSGVFHAGDDDSGPGLMSQITVNLVPGVIYTLVTTNALGAAQAGSYQWDVSGVGSMITPGSGTIQWFTVATGGTPIATGSNFDPVGPPTNYIANTNSGGVYNFWAACSSSPNDRTLATYTIGKTWNGSADSDWNNAANWNPIGVPTATDCVAIPNTTLDPIISSATNAEALSLTVLNGGVLTQNSNSTLTITDDVSIIGVGTYNIEDSASLIQINDAAINSGNIVMDRTVSIIENDYVYWSSPVASFPIQNVSPGTNSSKYEWLPTTFQGIGPPGNMLFGDWQSYISGVMDLAKGYIIKGPAGHGNTSAPYTATFTGTPNNGIITKPIERAAYTGGGYFYNPSGTNLWVTADDDNWNLVGNPYPSAINAMAFLNHPSNTNIDGFVYLWTHNTDLGAVADPFYEDFLYNYDVNDYIAYNAAGVSTPVGFSGNIAAGQGFFVLMNDTATANENVTFDNSLRNSTYGNNQFYRSANTDEDNLGDSHKIWLDFITPSGGTNTALVAYVSGATNDKDRMFDAKITRGNGLNLYSMIDDDAYIIQGRQLPFTDTDVVPLGLNVTEAGIQTFAINTLEGVFSYSEQNIYIEDLVTGLIHNLNNAPYTFTSEAGIINDRFVLKYTTESLSIKDVDVLNGIKVFEENDKLVVNSNYGSIQSIEVYDMLGRTLFTNSNINLDDFTVDTISSNDTALVLKIKLVDGQQKIAKIIF